MAAIKLRGVRTHNLKNVDVDIPRDKLTVITGLSGSGKSSLAFDTLYAEGQRRYVESLSSYARQFLSMMAKPDVDLIEGLSPAISIEQKATSHNPRSTVGTTTEIHDYLRLLFARVGVPHCPKHHTPLSAQTITQMVDHLMSLPEGSRVMLLAPVVRARKGEHLQLFSRLQAQGFVRVRVNGEVMDVGAVPKLALRQKHHIDVVVDRLKIRPDIELRLSESIETALAVGDGLLTIASMDAQFDDQTLSAKHACPTCAYSVPDLEPRLFSFNNPVGACDTCDGLGLKQDFDESEVIFDESFSLSGGAIRGWDKRTTYYFQLLTSLAKHYDFDVDAPFSSLPKKVREVILYGSGKQAIPFVYVSQRGMKVERKHPFEGVIPNMRRRYRESDSNAVREELSKLMSVAPCDACEGDRLCTAARHVLVAGKNLPELSSLSISNALGFFKTLTLPGNKGDIAKKILKEVNDRLGFLVNVGLNYLSLSRSADTLSGGEAQRIRLASQIGSGLVGVMYILDEPSIGLHQRDNERLLSTLTHLRDLGNTVIVVEHDEDAIRLADHVIDVGPGAGVHGGHIVASGTLSDVLNNKASLTGQYLSGEKQIPMPERRVNAELRPRIKLTGARCNNLQSVTLEIPLGLMTCVTGVSGSGKSSLINRTLYPILVRELNRAKLSVPGEYDTITGLDELDKVVDINQSPIGRTPRSNPATYTGLFTPIRELFAATQEARSRGYKPGRFSFNVKGGRCEACEGDGVTRVEMHFLADVFVECDVCRGKRYHRDTLDIKYKGKNVHEILSMTVETARVFFDAIPTLKRKLQTLMDVGLSYITLGQSAITLSGGEAQRVKLAKELSKRDTGSTCYILDEPTTGLHFHDIVQLLSVLHHLRDKGNTIVVIEHNLDVIKTADYIIDMGPEGGEGGGQIVAAGSPEYVMKQPDSHTGRFLKRHIKGEPC